jgi:hypothetical protein
MAIAINCGAQNRTSDSQTFNIMHIIDAKSILQDLKSSKRTLENARNAKEVGNPEPAPEDTTRYSGCCGVPCSDAGIFYEPSSMLNSTN